MQTYKIMSANHQNLHWRAQVEEKEVVDHEVADVLGWATLYDLHPPLCTGANCKDAPCDRPILLCF